MFNEMRAYAISGQGFSCDGGPGDADGCDCDQCDSSDGGQ